MSTIACGIRTFLSAFFALLVFLVFSGLSAAFLLTAAFFVAVVVVTFLVVGASFIFFAGFFSGSAFAFTTLDLVFSLSVFFAGLALVSAFSDTLAFFELEGLTF